MLPNRTKSKPIPLKHITFPSRSRILTPQANRTSIKRNRTFFERFNHVSPTAIFEQQQNDSPSEPQTRLRRRFTFRRSLRQSIQNKGGDIDDGIRSVWFIPCYPNIFIPIYYRRDR